MLDVFYPSLADLVRACREIRAYLRTPNPVGDDPRTYNVARILPMFSEEIMFDADGTPRVVYVRHI